LLGAAPAPRHDEGGLDTAVALRLDFTNFGLDDYDAICKALSFPDEWPDGLLVGDGRGVVIRI